MQKNVTMKKIANADLGRPTPEEFAVAEKIPVAVVLDNVRSQNNVGSFFRTCDAFAINGLHLCGITSAPPHKEIHKTALGAEISVPWRYHERTVDAVRQLRREGYRVLAVEQVEGAVMLDRLKVRVGETYALVFGNEVNGVDQQVVDLCDGAVEIPQRGTKHSLNVAVSGGVVLWEFFRQFCAPDEKP